MEKLLFIDIRENQGVHVRDSQTLQVVVSTEPVQTSSENIFEREEAMAYIHSAI